jgi:two-component system heavy metal sensor histidine kinase CusS
MKRWQLGSTDFPSSDGVDGIGDHDPFVHEVEDRTFLLFAACFEAGAGAGMLGVQFALDATEDFALLASYRRRMAVILLAAFFLSLWIGHAIARRGLDPVKRFGESLERIESTTLSDRIDPRGLPVELENLAITCNRMLDGLEESFARLTRFSADIAHELRTPLNNLCCGVGVGISRPRSIEEYEAVLGSCLEDSQRLSKLVDSLLFLARTEGSATHARKESLDLGGEIARVSEFYDVLATEGAVSLTVDAEGDLTAPVDRTLFQSAVGNLVENAITATPPYGRVSIHARKDGNEVRIDVSDTGAGIPAEHLPHVFDRLYRVDASRTTNGMGAGAGLGLAIVKGIVTLHDGTVTIDSKEGAGTTATLRFPACDKKSGCCPPSVSNST